MNGSKVIAREYECLCTGCMYPRSKWKWCRIEEEKQDLISDIKGPFEEKSPLLKPDPKTKERRKQAIVPIMLKVIRQYNWLDSSIYKLIDIFLFGGGWTGIKMDSGIIMPRRTFLSPFDYTYANYKHPFCLAFFMESKTIPNAVDTQNIVNLKKALLKLKNKLSDEFIQRVNIKEDGWKENETASTGVLRIIENKETKFGEQSYSNWVKCMGRFLDKIIWLRSKKLTNGNPVVWSEEQFLEYLSELPKNYFDLKPSCAGGCTPKPQNINLRNSLFRDYCPEEVRKSRDRDERRAWFEDEFGEEEFEEDYW